MQRKPQELSTPQRYLYDNSYLGFLRFESKIFEITAKLYIFSKEMIGFKLPHLWQEEFVLSVPSSRFLNVVESQDDSP